VVKAIAAIESGRIVPSNWWRAREVVRGIEQTGIGEAAAAPDAYEAHRPTSH
jgi:hypothetical protein